MLTITILILLDSPVLAQEQDTVVVRLRKGGLIHGTMLSNSADVIHIRTFGGQEYTFSPAEITMLASREEYDSLSSDPTFTFPPPEIPPPVLAGWAVEILAGTALNHGRGPGLGARGYYVTGIGILAGGIVSIHPDLSSGRGPSRTGPLSYLGLETGMDIALSEYNLQPVVGIGATLLLLSDFDANKSNASGETIYAFSTGLTLVRRLGALDMGLSPRIIFVPGATSLFLYISIGRAW
jgi:hypothetical protein